MTTEQWPETTGPLYNPGDLTPRHPFVPDSDPHFGSAFGGGCGARDDDGLICGWPRHVHPEVTE